MTGIQDDLATLRYPVVPQGARDAAADRVEAEIARLEDDLDRERANHETLWRYQRDRAVAAEAEVARLKDGLRHAQDVVGYARSLLAGQDATPELTWAVGQWDEWLAEDGAARHPLIQTERPPEHVFEEFRKLHGAEDGAATPGKFIGRLPHIPDGAS